MYFIGFGGQVKVCRSNVSTIQMLAIMIATVLETLCRLSQTFSIVSDGRGVGRYATIETQELRLPLRMGWKRETTVREYSKSGIRGDVVYLAPCGKKFKQYPDIMRVRCHY